ncbi:MAG TPA: DUF4384 domain-containing protein [Terracidiphilus sp.]|nr:DUF4384 domain-containing protein [Terracidiphilus sp.]
MTARNATFPAALALLLPVLAPAQQFTARDAFWSSSDLITVTPNPAAHKSAATHPHPQRTGTSATGPERNSQVAQLVAENGYGAAPHLVRASEDRLGLRCSILLRGANDEYNEVAPGSIFHSGDHIRLSFLANQAGYFYVIQQGSTGTWSPIFPPPNSGADANRISAGTLQTVPSGTKTFAFDQNPGDEKLYVLLSRAPIPDIDRAIQNLKSGQPAESPSAPSSSGPMVEAENRIPDAFVKGIASRDLVLVDEQKVDESSKGDAQGEKAIYVVAKASGPAANSQVVLSLELRHE